MSKVKCKQCYFHEALPNKGRDGAGEPTDVGNCMRYPPQVGVSGTSFPVVGSNTNWCGEFRAVSGAKRKTK